MFQKDVFVVVYRNAPQFLGGIDKYFEGVGDLPDDFVVGSELGKAMLFRVVDSAIEISHAHPVLDDSHLVAQVWIVIERSKKESVLDRLAI